VAKIHKKILDTLGDNRRGLSLKALEKRLHPLMPAAIQKAVGSLLDKEELEEGPGGRLRVPEKRSAPARGPRASKPSASTKAAKDAPRYAGRISLHRDGFGFVTPEDGSLAADVFVPPGALGGAFPGDRVEVALIEQSDKADKRYKGEVVQVLSRARDTMCGFLEQVGPKRFVLMPTDPNLSAPIPLDGTKFKDAHPGDVIKVKLFESKKLGGMAGKFVERMGSEGDPSLDTTMLIAENGIRDEWPAAVLKAAEAIPQEVPEGALAERVDLRAQPCFTIDGKDSRDLDDAVYIEALPGDCFRLWVHIADVSHYVRPGDVIDEEAVQRGTSTYFPERVVPMLPQALSNGICSLNPGVDRLALTARMDFDREGVRKAFKLMSTVINSHHRLNYEDVHNACIGLDRPTRKRLRRVLPDLERAFLLADLMKARRIEAGYLDFDIPEVKVKVNELGEPVDVKPVPDNKAYGLIEQFMVAANEAVSDWMHAAEKPFVYRIHDVPDTQKLTDLTETARAAGLRPGRLAVKDPSAPLQAFLGSLHGRPDEHTLRIQLLRCMKLAEYNPENRGHFGLGSKAYTHFTSPIRRYPDLIVHRLLKDRAKVLSLGKKKRASLVEDLPALCRECSRLERVAETAEREAVRLKKLHYLAQRVGETFEARVSGVTHFGLFLELDGVLAEGLLHISNLGSEYFHYEEERRELVGNETGRVYRMGTRLTVRVDKVDLRERRAFLQHVDAGPEYDPAEEDDEIFVETTPRGRRGRRGRRRKATLKPQQEPPPRSKKKEKPAGSRSKSSQKPSRTPAKSRQKKAKKRRKR
jgi:ribonuclease R